MDHDFIHHLPPADRAALLRRLQRHLQAAVRAYTAQLAVLAMLTPSGLLDERIDVLTHARADAEDVLVRLSRMRFFEEPLLTD